VTLDEIVAKLRAAYDEAWGLAVRPAVRAAELLGQAAVFDGDQATPPEPTEAGLEARARRDPR